MASAVSREVPASEEQSNEKKSVVLPARLEELPPYLTVDETAALLRTSRAAIYTMADRGRLPGLSRVGRRILVCRDDLLEWLEQSRVPSPRNGVRR